MWCKAHIQPETTFGLATQRKCNEHKQHEMYMANMFSLWVLALGQWGFALGRLGIAFGPQGYLETNMLVSAMQNSRNGGQAKREPPT